MTTYLLLMAILSAYLSLVSYGLYKMMCTHRMKKGYAMIIYATKKTIETYKLKMPEEFIDPTVRSLVQSIIEKEQGNRLFEWGAKLFYFDGRKCLC